MLSALQWFLFGMMIWCCCVAMSAISRKWAPEMMDDSYGHKRKSRRKRHHRSRNEPDSDATSEDPRDIEILQLKKRVETLEAIVTDRKYQWEQELNS